MNRKTIVFCVFLAVVLTVPAFPLMLRLSLQELTGNAEMIAAGKVVERECRWGERGKWIYTYVKVAVDEYIKGEGKEIVLVRHLGGEVGEKGLIVGNMPRFREGEEVLVFLRGVKQSLQLQVGEGEAEQALQLQVEEQEAGDNLTALDMQEGNGGIYRVSGLAQGKYEIFADESGRRMVRNSFSDLCVQDAGEMKILNEKVLQDKPLSEFISEIRKILNRHCEER